MLLSYNIPDNSISFVEKALRTTKLKAVRFGFWFWGLTLFSLFFGFFAAMMGTVKLASSRFPEEYKAFADLFVQMGADGKPVDQWPIFTLWIGVTTSIISGLLALFVVRKRWIINKRLYNNILLERKVYDSSTGIYKDTKTRDFALFERVSEILSTNTRLLERWAKNEK